MPALTMAFFLAAVAFLAALPLLSGADGLKEKSASGNLSSTLQGTPFGALNCPSAIARDGNHIFSDGRGTWPSCNLPARSDGAFMCVDGAGQADYTSVFVDLTSVASKTGCFIWSTYDCNFDLLRVHQITFDADLRNCQSVWAAPLWLSPVPWVAPAWTSGEIDLIELCPHGSIATNFGAAGGPGEHQQVWGSADGMGGPRRYTMSLDRNTGTLTTQICNIDGSGCFTGAYYDNFLNTVTSTKGRAASLPYRLNVDIWNGYQGDGGWTGCDARNDPNSQCQFALKNIKIHTRDGSAMFAAGKCAALNGHLSETETALEQHLNETLVIV